MKKEKKQGIRTINYRRRELQKKRKRILTTFLLAAIFLLGSSITFIYNNMTTKAAGKDEAVSYKYYTSVQIKDGDSLWTLADQYMDASVYDSKKDYMKELKEINHLDSEEIHEGQYLTVSYHSNEFK